MKVKNENLDVLRHLVAWMILKEQEVQSEAENSTNEQSWEYHGFISSCTVVDYTEALSESGCSQPTGMLKHVYSKSLLDVGLTEPQLTAGQRDHLSVF